MAVVRVKQLNVDAYPLKKTSPHSEGYDLCSMMDIAIKPGEVRFFPTGLSIQCSRNIYGHIYGRSSHAMKGLIVHNGIIDQDYTGQLAVIVGNYSKNTYNVRKGHRIAQLIFKKRTAITFVNQQNEKIEIPTFTPIRTGGFGSSGKKSFAKKPNGCEMGNSAR